VLASDDPSVDNAQATQLHDLLLAGKPEGAKHNAEICVFCVEKASQSAASGNPPDVSENQSTEGGATPTMNDTIQQISMEAHTALVKQEVEKACQASDQALATQTEKANTATARVTVLETELASVKQELADVNAKRDEDAVKINGLTEENAQLKKDKADDESRRQLEDKSSERAKQVTNLNLFPEAYVTEKAQKWAELSDEAWAEQVESWQKLKPAGDGAGAGEGGGDQASSMTGGDGTLTSTKDDASDSGGGEKKTPARRAVLGLK
jgi:hypothetical protein